MIGSLSRIGSIVRADFLIRFRRVSTLVVFLLLSAFAYYWIPDPATGRALIQINGHRAFYNSGAIGMATALLAMLFVGLFGYYVISNAVRRDITSRCGFVIGSTPMRTGEYLVGKFLGNLAFLVTFLCGFMLSSMAMLLVRGEAPLEPLVFVHQYLLLTPPAIVFVSAVAVLFESIPWLSGKLGDVVYFFLWVTITGLVVGNEASGEGIPWARYLDFNSFGFVVDRMQRTLQTESVSIGASTFDPEKAPVVFPGISLSSDWILPRTISTLLPILVLLPLATLFFHRFDPVRVRRTSEKTHRNWLTRIQRLFKPLSRRFVAVLLVPVRGNSFLAKVWSDAVLTFTLAPFALVAFLAVSVLSLSGPRQSNLPMAFALLALALSDVATRDRRAGTTLSLRAVPRLRENFVWWKLGSALVLALLFFVVPILRAAAEGGWAMLMLLVGITLTATTATALGVVSANAKTFIVGFLTFWYVVINDRGQSPMSDFAGFYGTANGRVALTYGALSLFALAFAQLFYRWRLNR